MFEETEVMVVVAMVACELRLRIHGRSKGEGRAG